MDDCTTIDTPLFDLSGAGTGGARLMTLNRFFFSDCSKQMNFDSTHTTNLLIATSTIFHKSYPDIGGNWKGEFSKCHIFSLGTERTVISTTNAITYLQCILANGLHFTSNPTVKIHQCTYNDDCGLAISGEDITSTVDLTDVDYVNNVQQNGLGGKVQIKNPIKNVGSGGCCNYYSLQDAITSIPASGHGTIVIHEDLIDLAELTLPTAAEITIDLQRKYSLTFTADIVEIGANQTVLLTRCAGLTGGNIEINGNNALLDIESSAYINAYITITSGTGAMAILYNSSLQAPAGHSAITINSLDPLLVLGYSRVKGITGYIPIVYSVLGVNKFKSKYSTILDVDGNAPIDYTGAGKVTMSMYATGLNAAWDANKFTNLINSAGNITDPELNF